MDIDNLLDLWRTHGDAVTTKHLSDVVDQRNKAGNLYTDMGSVLFAATPLEQGFKPDWSKLCQDHKDIDGEDMKPGIVRLCSTLVEGIKMGEKSQAVLYNGVSGAGKSENVQATLLCLNELLSGDAINIDQLYRGSDLLSVLGNAATSRNLNSSRFNKLLTIYISDDGKCQVLGARVECHLLEDSRVSTPILGESNMLILHQLAKQGDQLYPELGLDLKLDMTLIRETGGRVDFGDLSYTTELLLRFTEQVEIDRIYKKLAAILHLGQAKHDDYHQAVMKASVLLGVGHKEIEKELEFKGYKIDQTQFDRKRNGLISRYFREVVKPVEDAINRVTCPNDNAAAGLALFLLDIQGSEFENRMNRYENLVINYTNDQIQHSYTSFVIQAKNEKYKANGLPPLTSAIPNHVGGPEQLDAMSQVLGDATQLGLNASIRTALGVLDDHTFNVKHGTGEVNYSAEDVVVKTAITEGGRKTSRFTAYTKGIRALHDRIAAGKMHYVRCLKTRGGGCQGGNGIHGEESLVAQIDRASWKLVFELEKSGWIIDFDYEEFIRVFGRLGDASSFTPTENYNSITCNILGKLSIPSETYHLGDTRIFFKSAPYKTLRNALNVLQAGGGKSRVTKVDFALDAMDMDVEGSEQGGEEGSEHGEEEGPDHDGEVSMDIESVPDIEESLDTPQRYHPEQNVMPFTPFKSLMTTTTAFSPRTPANIRGIQTINLSTPPPFRAPLVDVHRQRLEQRIAALETENADLQLQVTQLEPLERDYQMLQSTHQVLDTAHKTLNLKAIAQSQDLDSLASTNARLRRDVDGWKVKTAELSGTKDQYKDERDAIYASLSRLLDMTIKCWAGSKYPLVEVGRDLAIRLRERIAVSGNRFQECHTLAGMLYDDGVRESLTSGLSILSLLTWIFDRNSEDQATLHASAVDTVGTNITVAFREKGLKPILAQFQTTFTDHTDQDIFQAYFTEAAHDFKKFVKIATEFQLSATTTARLIWLILEFAGNQTSQLRPGVIWRIFKVLDEFAMLNTWKVPKNWSIIRVAAAHN